ncbi:MAG: hypothetical protein ABIA04_15445 [Pseudomonadota bacterium]
MAAYPITDLILQAMQDKQLSKKDLVQAMNYKNIAKGLRRLDRFLECKRFYKGIIEKLPQILGLDESSFKAEIARTQALIAKEKEDKERQAFVPHIIVKHERTGPSLIFVVAITGVERFKYIVLPANIAELSEAEQFDIIRETLKAHYIKNMIENKAMQLFGDITGYFYRQTYDRTILFSVKGEVLNAHLGKKTLPKASLHLEGDQRDISFNFKNANRN